MSFSLEMNYFLIWNELLIKNCFNILPFPESVRNISVYIVLGQWRTLESERMRTTEVHLIPKRISLHQRSFESILKNILEFINILFAMQGLICLYMNLYNCCPSRHSSEYLLVYAFLCCHYPISIVITSIFTWHLRIRLLAQKKKKNWMWKCPKIMYFPVDTNCLWNEWEC